ncbi:MAG TPA: SRPBCC domain-containing protein [Elusimicrobiota bacterium]|nr:SRPBCC domain-containing protein [Elusimicrobiota bacterium]
MGPDGSEYLNTTTFVEIVEPDHIAYANVGGKKGEKEVRHLMTFSLKALGSSKTEVTIHHVFDTRQERDFAVERYGAIEGGRQTLSRLAAHVQDAAPGSKPGFELRLERVVDAPLKRVWRAWAEPKELARWFAPRPLTLSVARMDFRPGGGFAMAMVFPDGNRHDFSGVYREVAPQSRIVWTGEFPGDPKDNIRTEISFEDLGARTKIRVYQTFALITPINEQATKGARQGWTMTLDQMTEHVLKK